MEAHFYRTPEWRRYADVLAARLEKLRKDNDNPDLDLAATQALRGQIGEIKRQLKDAEKALRPPADTPADE